MAWLQRTIFSFWNLESADLKVKRSRESDRAGEVAPVHWLE
jgi:hypothetical protein